jgi:hypothetical protein
MLLRTTLLTASVTTLLVACQSAPKVDDTPEMSTSVATASVRNFGFKGFFANDGTETLWTNPEMQRQDQQFKFTGDVLSIVGRKQDRSNITRLDKNLVWQMDNRKKRYTECSVVGCGALGSFNENVFAGEESDDTGEQCNVKLTKFDLSVNKTGQSRVINNFPTEEFVMNWTMEIEDDQQRKTENVITSTVWTTPGDGGATEAIQMQKTFADARARMMLEQSGALATLNSALPGEAMAVLQRFLVEGLPADIQARIKQMAGQQAKITGLPISTKVEWNAKAEACGEAEKAAAKEEEDQLNTSSVKGLLASVGKQVLKQKAKKIEDAKKKEIEMAPVFGYVKEITAINMQNVRLSKMQVPANYKLNNRK